MYTRGDCRGDRRGNVRRDSRLVYTLQAIVAATIAPTVAATIAPCIRPIRVRSAKMRIFARTGVRCIWIEHEYGNYRCELIEYRTDV